VRAACHGLGRLRGRCCDRMRAFGFDDLGGDVRV